MGQRSLVLLVEDDPETISTVTSGLGSNFDILVRGDTPRTGGECSDFLVNGDYAALIMSLHLVNDNWLEMLQEIRQHDQTLPVILLIDSVPPGKLVPVLHAGACDFIRKPIDSSELETRLRLLLRNRGRPAQEILEFGGIQLNRLRHEVRVHGERVALTRLEYRLLERFLSRTEGVHTRQSLLKQVWGLSFDPGTNVVDVHIANLRRKLRQKRPNAAIVTVRGVGFRMTAKVSEPEYAT